MIRHPNWSATKAIHYGSSNLLQWGFKSHTYEHRRDDAVDEKDNDDDFILNPWGKMQRYAYKSYFGPKPKTVRRISWSSSEHSIHSSFIFSFIKNLFIIAIIAIIINIIIIMVDKQSDVPPSNPGSRLDPINLGLLPNWGILSACQWKRCESRKEKGLHLSF